MNETTELLLRAVAIGSGATLATDGWAFLLRRLGIPSLDFALLGRWALHLPEGRFVHESIARATPVRGELLVGWSLHYAIGITFALLLLEVYGLAWGRSPSLVPALVVGIGTVLAPLLVLQPALGAGIASSKTAAPLFNAMKSVGTHTVYGLGLYVSALVTSAVFPGAR